MYYFIHRSKHADSLEKIISEFVSQCLGLFLMCGKDQEVGILLEKAKIFYQHK